MAVNCGFQTRSGQDKDYDNWHAKFCCSLLSTSHCSCGTVALYGPFFSFFFTDHRATDFTYIKTGGIATKFKSHLSMGRLMIDCKCVLPCVVISFHKTFFYIPTYLFIVEYSYPAYYYDKYIIMTWIQPSWISTRVPFRVTWSAKYKSDVGVTRVFVLVLTQAIFFSVWVFIARFTWIYERNTELDTFISSF